MYLLGIPTLGDLQIRNEKTENYLALVGLNKHIHAPGVKNQYCHLRENSVTLSYDFYVYELERSN
jgi:hypothetical protein